MNHLEKLLEGVEVEWKTLGEVAELKRGTTITAKSKTDGNIPVIRYISSYWVTDNKLKGFLFGHTGLFYHKYTDNPKQILVKQIFGGELERIDEYSNESKIIESNSCNVYGIDKEKFDLIVQFLDNKIVSWASKLATEEGILELLTNASPTRIWSLNGKGSNSDFIKYVQLNFPNINIKSELDKK